MTVSFPLTDLVDAMQATVVSFAPDYGQEYSGTGGGFLIVKDLRPELWHAKFTSKALPHGEYMQVMARINSLRGSLFTFYAYDPRSPGPQNDLDGSTLDASVVKIDSLNGDNRRMTLKGLPAHYKLKSGDYLSFDFGSPASRARHQILEDATADGSGVTPNFEVSGFIRTGAAVNDVVTLLKASAEMRILPGTLSEQSVNRMKSQVSFEAIQTFNV